MPLRTMGITGREGHLWHVRRQSPRTRRRFADEPVSYVRCDRHRQSRTHELSTAQAPRGLDLESAPPFRPPQEYPRIGIRVLCHRRSSVNANHFSRPFNQVSQSSQLLRRFAIAR